MRIDAGKVKYFLNGNAACPVSDPPYEWKLEKEACNCDSVRNPCYGIDAECPYRNTTERLPLDVGGQGQCLRLALVYTPYAFTNVDGRVIAIPEKIAQEIAKNLK